MENYEKNIVDPKYVYEKLDVKNFKVIDCTVYFELKKEAPQRYTVDMKII
ncbi:hypothetical protein OA410_00885 [Paracoccaceae bacterium]|nr:hypothetical protein [Paracoccaceae bacterium]